jgi:hypothetical protein
VSAARGPAFVSANGCTVRVWVSVEEAGFGRAVREGGEAGGACGFVAVVGALLEGAFFVHEDAHVRVCVVQPPDADSKGARNTALGEHRAVTPPPLVADALGYSYQVAFLHADAAGKPWSRYVDRRTEPE